jgi:hypothetical protein
MRRIFIMGGIGLALGVFANPSLGQEGNFTHPSRVAKLGVPVAIPDDSSDPGITPAGLLTRWQGAPPGGMVHTQGLPLPGRQHTQVVAPIPSMGASSPIISAQPVTGSAPSVTEIRYPNGVPANPLGTIAAPSLVPSVAPGGIIVPQPGLENPLCADCIPGAYAMDRLAAPSKWWASAEYMMWWTKSASLPTLLTTSSPEFNGIPGIGNTSTVLGGTFGNNLHSGGRFAVGRWFGNDQIRGVEGRLFFLGRTDSTFAATSAEYPLLARPFINVNTPVGPFSEVISDPARGLGAAVVDLQTSVWGAEANYRRFLWGTPCARLDAIVGYRYFGMKDRLSISESFTSMGNGATTVGGIPVISGTVSDVFRSENHFHGGQIGLAWELRRGRWTFDGRTTVAFGNLTQIAEIDGGQSLTLANGTVANFAGGLLALQGANIGRYTNNQFAVIPEVGVNVGYQVTSNMRLFVGYNFMYLGNALRAEGLINPNVDIARIPNFPVPGGGTIPVPGMPQPAPLFRTSDFFVQGISFGLEYRW